MLSARVGEGMRNTAVVVRTIIVDVDRLVAAGQCTAPVGPFGIVVCRGCLSLTAAASASSRSIPSLTSCSVASPSGLSIDVRPDRVTAGVTSFITKRRNGGGR